MASPDRTVFIFTVAVKDASDWPSRMSLCALRKEDLRNGVQQVEESGDHDKGHARVEKPRAEILCQVLWRRSGFGGHGKAI